MVKTIKMGLLAAALALTSTVASATSFVFDPDTSSIDLILKRDECTSGCGLSAEFVDLSNPLVVDEGITTSRIDELVRWEFEEGVGFQKWLWAITLGFKSPSAETATTKGVLRYNALLVVNDGRIWTKRDYGPGYVEFDDGSTLEFSIDELDFSSLLTGELISGATFITNVPIGATPLPAGGVLLLTVLAGGIGVSRMRRKA